MTSSMLPADELSEMRAVQALVMPESGQLKRKSVTNTATGTTDSWTNSGSPFSCRIDTLGSSPQERVIADRLGDHVGYVLMAPFDIAAQLGDHIVIGSRTFNVVGFLEKSYQTAKKIVCIETL